MRNSLYTGGIGCRLLLVSPASVTIAVFAMLTASAAAQTATFRKLYDFQGSPDGKRPLAGVLVGTGGALFGTTGHGGTTNSGTVFQLSPPAQPGGTWTEAVLYSFFNAPDGAYPEAGVAFGPAGTPGPLFGTTAAGGTGTHSGGTVFELAPPATTGGPWTESVLYSFPGSGGRNSPGTGTPEATPLIDSTGTIYGTTHGSCNSGDTYDPAIAFTLTPPTAPGGAWAESTIFNFVLTPQGFDGICPAAAMISQGGSLLGTAYNGGVSRGGTVYELTPPSSPGGVWMGIAVHAFTDSSGDGAYPLGPLTAGAGGVLYGTTSSGGTSPLCLGSSTGRAGCGTVFQLTPPSSPGGSWTETVLYSFTAVNGDGAYPTGNIVLAANGSLYGTTQYGGGATSGSACSYNGITGCGTVFQLTPPTPPGGAWTETVLYSFSGSGGEGSIPNGLTAGPHSVLYGTTQTGGAKGAGIVFLVIPD